MKSYKKIIWMILIILGAYLITFHGVPFVQAWLDSRQMKKGIVMTEKVVKDEIDLSSKEELKKIERNTEKLQKVLNKIKGRKFFLLKHEPETKKFLLKAHLDSSGKLSTYCFSENKESLPEDEIETWVKQFNPDELFEKLRSSLFAREAYQRKYHGGSAFYVMYKLAGHLVREHPFNFKLRFYKNYFYYLNLLTPESKAPPEPETLEFLEKNSKFLTNEHFFSEILPKIKEWRMHHWADSVEAGFRKMMADVGGCPPINISLKDLISPNTSCENSDNWKGPYVDKFLAEEVKEDPSSLIYLGPVERFDREEKIIYKFVIEVEDFPFFKTFEVTLPGQAWDENESSALQ